MLKGKVKLYFLMIICLIYCNKKQIWFNVELQGSTDDSYEQIDAPRVIVYACKLR